MRQKQSVVLKSTSDRRAVMCKVFSGDPKPVVTPLLLHGSCSLLSWLPNPGEMRDSLKQFIRNFLCSVGL